MGNFKIERYERGSQGNTPFSGPGEHDGKSGFKFTSFRIDYPLAARLDQIAQGEDVTFTTVVTRLLEKGVKEFGKIKKGVEPRFGPSEHARENYGKKNEEAPAKKKAKKKVKEAPEAEEAPKKKKAKKKVKAAPAEEAPKKKKAKKKVKAAPAEEAEPETETEAEPEIADEG